jgi:hypothetical protein
MVQIVRQSRSYKVWRLVSNRISVAMQKSLAPDEI